MGKTKAAGATSSDLRTNQAPHIITNWNQVTTWLYAIYKAQLLGQGPTCVQAGKPNGGSYIVQWLCMDLRSAALQEIIDDRHEGGGYIFIAFSRFV